MARALRSCAPLDSRGRLSLREFFRSLLLVRVRTLRGILVRRWRSLGDLHVKADR